MDCLKAALCSTTSSIIDNEKLPKSRPSTIPTPVRTESKHSTTGSGHRHQFDMPYDPIDLGMDDNVGDASHEGEMDAEYRKHPSDSRQQQRDWWETLFPARFALDSTSSDGEPDGFADVDPMSQSQSGRRVDNAYRRVWERLQREEAAAATAAASEAANMKFSADSSVTEDDDVTASSCRRRAPKPSGASKRSPADCLWTSEELQLFRDELAKLKKENHVLKAAVRYQAERLRCLDTKCRAQSRQLESKSGAAGESAKACERYRILADSMQTRTTEAERQCADLRANLALAIEERDQARAEGRRSAEQLQRLGAKLGRLKRREAGVREELVHDFALREEQLRADQANQLRQLEDSLADLRAELRKERYLHGATRLGHQQLLSHFSANANASASAGSRGDTVCSACGGAGGGRISDGDIRLF